MKIQTGIYRHYKGPRYLVIGLARYSETEEPMVVYLPLEKRDPKNPRERQRLCVRPLKGPEGFMTSVAKGKPRFKLETAFDFGLIPK